MIGRDVKKMYRNQCHNNGTKVLTIVGNATKYSYFYNLNFKLQCPGLQIFICLFEEIHRRNIEVPRRIKLIVGVQFPGASGATVCKVLPEKYGFSVLTL